MIKKLLASIISLLFTTMLQANAVFPFLLVIARANEAFPYFYIAILLMVFVEFIIFCLLLPQESRLKIALVTILMNIASAIVGLISLFLGFDLVAPLFIYMFKLPPHYQFYGYALWYAFYMTSINTIVEYWIAEIWFKKYNARKLLFYIFLINAASTFIYIGTPFIYEYYYGPLKITA